MATLIELNVGGRNFTTFKSTLEKYPDSFFDALVSDRWEAKDKDGRYFIDRDGDVFANVLKYMRTDKIPTKIDQQEFQEELEYFGMVEKADVDQDYATITTILCCCHYRKGMTKNCTNSKHYELFELQEKLENSYEIQSVHVSNAYKRDPLSSSQYIVNKTSIWTFIIVSKTPNKYDIDFIINNQPDLSRQGSKIIATCKIFLKNGGIYSDQIFCYIVSTPM